MKEENFRQRIIKILSDGIESDNTLIEQINQIPDDGMIYSNILALFVHLSCTEDEAKDHWNKILEDYDYLEEVVDKRKIGLRVAILDYFINLSHLLNNPIIVEIQIFKETQKLALVDKLTGLYNRSYMETALNKEIKRSDRYNKDFSILLLDIDDFKSINNEKGHQFGDDILRVYSQFIKASCRGEDIVCRYGGEEFLIIFPETSFEGAVTFGERLRNNLKQIDLFKENNITFSGGISTYPYDGKSVSDLIRNADKSLYAAKYQGKDCIIKKDSDDKRRFKRFNLSWKLLFRPFDNLFKTEKFEEVYTHDLSLGGVRFQSSEELDIESKLLFEIEIPDNDDIVVFGKVVWVKKKDSNRFEYGIQFRDLNKDQIDKLRRIVTDSDFDS